MKLKPPKQYQQGWTEFFKLKFKLTRDVLIPRPETELLVEEVIIRNPKTVLEIGTGSGCIAVSIAKNLPDSKIIATDISEKALLVAKLNSKTNKVEDQIIFIQSDLINFVPLVKQEDQDNKVTYVRNFVRLPDIIVANLPYIPTSRLMFIDPMVKDFEPRIALDGGQDGFEIYRKLFAQMKEKKFYPKMLVAEIDYIQAELAIDEALKYFPEATAYVKKDLSKTDRILVIKFK